jgi:hypothetical protein
MTVQNGEVERPTKLSAEAKAERTNTIARDILAAEVNARERKTERLRALRMAQPAPEPAPKKRGGRASPSARP